MRVLAIVGGDQQQQQGGDGIYKDSQHSHMRKIFFTVIGNMLQNPYLIV